MADNVILPPEQQFSPHPEGQHILRCVDVVNLGQRVEHYPGQPPQIVPKVALVFVSGERRDDGDLHILSIEHRLSRHENANLRKMLESWRGRSFTKDELDQPLDLTRLVGATGLATIEHKPTKSNRTVAKIKTLTPVPKGLTLPPTLPPVEVYVRPDFFTTRKAAYAAELQAFRAAANASGDEPPPPDDDDLPF